MAEITAYFLNLLEILEKEWQLLRLTAAKTVKGLGWFGIGILLLTIGLLLLAWTCFTALAQIIGPVGAGLATSLLILAVGGIFLWMGSKSLK